MPARRSERGGSALALVLVLLMGLGLALLYSHGALIFEQRSSAQQVRATLALHAAEAGRDWAIALLNHPGTLDASCTPTDAGSLSPGNAGSSLRERYLATDPTTGLTAPAVTARPGCVHDGGTRWTCSCPASGDAALSAADPATLPGDQPAFTVAFSRGPQPGSLRLAVTGCSGIGSAGGSGCGGTAAADARVDLHQLLQAQGALRRLPAAALVSAGPVAVGASTTLVNGDPSSGGLTVQGGAGVTVDPLARLLPPAGRAPADSIVAADPSLGGGGDAPWRLWFGLSEGALRALPTWQRLGCAGTCSADQVSAALDTGQRALWLDGALQVSSEVSWGSDARPVLLVVRGAVQLNGPMRLRGLLIATSVQWQQSASGSARLQGAVVSLGSSSLSGPVELVRDAALLQRLRELPGAYLPVPGSWQDFDNR